MQFDTLSPVAISPSHVVASAAPHEYRADIDGLRALAIAMVVAFHAFPSLFRGGFAGVDVFFVISGYLISQIVFGGLAQGNFSFRGFYARRVRRIFPALMLVLAACYAVGRTILMPQEYMQLGEHIAGGAGFASNFMLWSEAWDNAGYFDVAAESKPLLHLWSLAVEEQFYIFWPALVVLGWKRRWNLARLVLVTAVVSFAFNLVMRVDAVAMFYLPLTRFWEILAGGWLAGIHAFHREWADDLARKTGRRLAGVAALTLPQAAAWLRDAMAITGFVLIAVAMLVLDREKVYPGAWALLPVAGTCLLIAAGPEAWFNRRVLSPRPLVYLGLISFPLYLWHWLLLSFARIYADAEPAAGVRLALVAASLLLASLTYFLVERPIRAPGRGGLKVAVLCMIAVLAGCAGWNVYWNNGLPSRFPPEIVKFIYAPDTKAQWAIGTGSGACQRDTNDPHFSGCVQREARPQVFIWGDSHAAALSAGFRDLQRRRHFGLSQFTVAGCPPLSDLGEAERAECRGLSERALARIKSAMPDVVIVHAYWQYRGYALYDARTRQFDISKMAATFARLKALGIRKIILIGPVPAWNHNLRRNIYTTFVRDPLHRLPPVRMKQDLQDGLQPTAAALAQLARDTNIDYLLPLDVLCSPEGCLTRMGPNDSEITAIDYGHLAPVAANYLVDAFAEPIFAALPGPAAPPQTPKQPAAAPRP